MQRATAAVVLVVGFGGLGSAMVLALSGAAAMGWALLQVLRLPGR